MLFTEIEVSVVSLYNVIVEDTFKSLLSHVQQCCLLFMIADYDECMGEGLGNECEQGCDNNPGGFNCTCFDGFELVNETQCQGNLDGPSLYC